MKGLDIHKRKVAVIGFGVSGKSVSRFFLQHDVSVDVYEDKKAEEFDQAAVSEFTADTRFTMYFANTSSDVDVTQYDYVIASPGVPLSHGLVTQAKKEGVEFVTDITVFIRVFRARYSFGRIVSVTGSNGKSTTVSLMYDAIRASETDVYLGGNIGTSPLDFFAEITTERPVVILETSSYQLEYLKDSDWFDVACITNISDNHLDRYGGSKDAYARAKLGGVHPRHTLAVINLDDPESKKYIVPVLPTRNVLGIQFESGFSPNVISLEGDALVYRTEEESTVLVSAVSKMNIKGLHNVYNCAVVCAVLVALEIDSTDAVERAIYDFSGLAHRVQYVDTIDGVTYINDSKSTTPASTNKALEAAGTDRAVVLITGGNDKGMPYEPMLEPWQQVVKGIILLPGTANPKLKVLAERSGVELLAEVQTMQEAVDVARSAAIEGDTVLLSPATTSYASFKSFEDRGEQFMACVQNLRS